VLVLSSVGRYIAPWARGRGFGFGLAGERVEEVDVERAEEVDVDVDLVVVEEVTFLKGSEGSAFASLVAERDLVRNARPRRVLRLGFGGGESILVLGVR
jgi:hypothetical protein